MPFGTSPAGSTYHPSSSSAFPPELLLQEQGPGLFAKAALGFLDALDFVVSDIPVAITGGSIPIPSFLTGGDDKSASVGDWLAGNGLMQDRVEDFNERLQSWGFGTGSELSEDEARAAQGAAWAGIGAALAPVTGGTSLAAVAVPGLIMGTIGAMIEPPKNVRELVGGSLDVGLDPLMFSRFGKVGDALMNSKLLGQKWTTTGKEALVATMKGKRFKRLAETVGRDAAIKEAEMSVIMGFSNKGVEDATKQALKRGHLDTGGWKVFDWEVPGSAPVVQGIAKGVKWPFEKSGISAFVRKHLNIAETPQVDDASYTASAAYRHTSAMGRDAIDEVQKRVLHETEAGLASEFTQEHLLRIADEMGEGEKLTDIMYAVGDEATTEIFEKSGQVSNDVGEVLLKGALDEALYEAGRRGGKVFALRKADVVSAQAWKWAAAEPGTHQAMKHWKVIDADLGARILSDGRARIRPRELEESASALGTTIPEGRERQILGLVDFMQDQYAGARAFAKSKGLHIDPIDHELTRQVRVRERHLAESLVRDRRGLESNYKGRLARTQDRIKKTLNLMKSSKRKLADAQRKAYETVYAMQNRLRMKKIPIKQQKVIMAAANDIAAKQYDGLLVDHTRRMTRLDAKLDSLNVEEKVVERLAQIHGDMLDSGVSLRGGATKAAAKGVDPKFTSAMLDRVRNFDPKLADDIQRGSVKLSSMTRRIQAEVEGLMKAAAESPAYSPRFLTDEARAFGRHIANNGAAYAKAVEEITERVRKEVGDALMLKVGGNSRGVSVKNFVEGILKNMIKRDLGESRFNVRTERSLGAEIFINLEDDITSTEVWRSMRPSELDPIIRAMEEQIGKELIRYKPIVQKLGQVSRTVGYPLRKLMYGQANANYHLKLKVPKFFDREPVMGVAKYWENLQNPVASVAAANRLVKDFGRRVTSKGGAADFKGETGKGWELIDDIPGLEGVAFPTTLIPDIRRFSHHYQSDESFGRVMAMFDTVQGWWKRQVLISPAYHSRNFISGLWQAMHMGNVTDPWAYTRALDLQAALGRFGVIGRGINKVQSMGKNAAVWKRTIKTVYDEDLTYRQIYEWAREDGIFGPGFFEFESKLTGQPLYKGVQNGVTAIDRAAFKYNAIAGQKVEETLRLAQYIDGLKRGLGRHTAAKQTGYTHYLYENLSPFERNYLKRLFPFYAWTRFTIPRQLLATIKNPRRPELVRHILENLENSDDQPHPSMKPDWVRRAMGVRIKTEVIDGKKVDKYFLLGSWWPTADLVKMGKYPLHTFLEMVTPVIKMPYEAITGDRWGGGPPISRFPGQRGQMFMPGAGVGTKPKDEIQGFQRMLTDAVGGNVDFDVQTVHAMRTIRMFNEMDRLLGPVFQDRVKGGLADPGTFGSRLVNMLVGIRSRTIDREKEASNVIYRNEKEFNDARRFYMRSVMNGDAANMKAVYDWMVSHGVPVPTDMQYRSFVKRSTAQRLKRSTKTRETVGALGGGQ